MPSTSCGIENETKTKLANAVYLKVFQASVHLIVEVFIPSKELNLGLNVHLSIPFLHFYLAPDKEIKDPLVHLK